MIKDRLISALLGSMFFIIFQPFDLTQFGTMRWLLLGGISLCIFVSCIGGEYLLRWVFRMPHDILRGQSYLLRRNAIFQLLNITIATALITLFLDRFCNNEVVNNHFSWNITLRVFGILCGCSLLIGLYWRNVYAKKDYQRRLEESMYLNGILEERRREADNRRKEAESQFQRNDSAKQHFQSGEESGNEDTTSSPIHITGTTKESVTLMSQDFIFAESDSNYVHIHYFKDDKVQKAMLRCSISHVEEVLTCDSNIMRCHRAFVVNLQQVAKVESQNQTLQLLMKGVHLRVPVSKTYLQEVKERIVNPA